MKLSLFGRLALASFAAVTLGLGMTGCGGGTIGFMWVLGQQYNQIAGFKIDDYTGNLTQIPHEPFSTNGVNPVSIVVKPGGRYVYVLNEGTGAVAPTATTAGVHATSGNVSVFSVGGDGTLTFQQQYTTQGFDSQWMQMDSTGTYLYVLDKYSPSYNGGTDVNGSITAYVTDSSSGRLTLLQNTQSVANGQPALTYFEVGSAGTTAGVAFPSPFMMKTAGNCLYTANASGIMAFAFSSGQLIPPTTQYTAVSTVGTKASVISSIAGNSTYVTVTDSGSNALIMYNASASCGLTTPTSGAYYSLASYGVTNPTWSLVENSGKYLYVTTGPTISTPTVASSTIVAFTINQTTQLLQPISGSPYGVGSGPVCMSEDPTNQYLYTSNSLDGTITGKVLDNTTGILSVLTRGSSFNTGNTGLKCLAVSGSVD